MQQAVAPHETVVEEFTAEAPLAVEEEGRPDQMFQKGPDESALVQVGMQDIGTEPPRRAQGGEAMPGIGALQRLQHEVAAGRRAAGEGE